MYSNVKLSHLAGKTGGKSWAKIMGKNYGQNYVENWGKLVGKIVGLVFGFAVVGVDLWFKGGIVGRVRVELGLGSIVGTRRYKRISVQHYILSPLFIFLQPNIRASPITAVYREFIFILQASSQSTGD